MAETDRLPAERSGPERGDRRMPAGASNLLRCPDVLVGSHRDDTGVVATIESGEPARVAARGTAGREADRRQRIAEPDRMRDRIDDPADTGVINGVDDESDGCPGRFPQPAPN